MRAAVRFGRRRDFHRRADVGASGPHPGVTATGPHGPVDPINGWLGIAQSLPVGPAWARLTGQLVS